MAEKKTKIDGIATVIGAIISVVFNLSLMKYGGVYIAAISSAVSFAAMNAILYNRMSYSEKSLKAPLIALFLFMVMSFGLFYIINISFSWEALFIKVLLLSLYFILLLKVFDVHIKDLLIPLNLKKK